MHFNDPVDEDASHFFINVYLLAHVALRGQVNAFNLLHVPQDRPTVLYNLLRVISVLVVNLLHVILLNQVDGLSPEGIYSLVYRGHSRGGSLLFLPRPVSF